MTDFMYPALRKELIKHVNSSEFLHRRGFSVKDWNITNDTIEVEVCKEGYGCKWYVFNKQKRKRR